MTGQVTAVEEVQSALTPPTTAASRRRHFAKDAGYSLAFSLTSLCFSILATARFNMLLEHKKAAAFLNESKFSKW